jgi:hypothetical protein
MCLNRGFSDENVFTSLDDLYDSFHSWFGGVFWVSIKYGMARTQRDRTENEKDATDYPDGQVHKTSSLFGTSPMSVGVQEPKPQIKDDHQETTDEHQRGIGRRTKHLSDGSGGSTGNNDHQNAGPIE